MKDARDVARNSNLIHSARVLDAIEQREEGFEPHDKADIYCEVSFTDEYLDNAINTWEAVP